MPEVRWAHGAPVTFHRADDFRRQGFFSPYLRSKCRTWLLRMSNPVVVQIVGAPIACKEGVKDGWREIAQWVGGQLRQRFGEGVHVQYFNLFDPDCPLIPPNAQLPLVLVNGEVLSGGGKISVPALLKKIESL
jgi:hypothetical protein